MIEQRTYLNATEKELILLTKDFSTKDIFASRKKRNWPLYDRMQDHEKTRTRLQEAKEFLRDKKKLV